MSTTKVLVTIILFYVAGLSVATADLSPHPYTLDPGEISLIEKVNAEKEAMLQLLEETVNINSGTLNKEGLDQVRAIFQNKLNELGFATKILPGGTVQKIACEGGDFVFADHLLAERAGTGPKLLLSGHLDTVFPKGHAFDKFEREGDIMKGPGVLDMKGGIVLMLAALKVLKENGELDGKHITVILNSDEELGSLTSRRYIEELSETHDYALVFEGTRGHKIMRTRKGLGQVRIKVNGHASHSGHSHHKGISAIKELAHKMVDLEALTNYETGATVNTGIVTGGVARNQVPACADAFVDLRYRDNTSGQKLLDDVRKVSEHQYTFNEHHQRGPTSEFWGILHRPVKPVNPGSDLLMSMYMGISEALGTPLTWGGGGGGTDGSITQLSGTPTVDNLGMNGNGSHSPREWASVESMMERTKIAILMIRNLSRFSVK